MADISATLVKELREKTGAGMLDCKKALAESAGDLEKAVDWLRAKGLSAAAKKAGRAASEGLVAVAVSGGAGAVVELNSETDFVARNEQFQKIAATVGKLALDNATGDVEALRKLPFPGSSRNVGEEIVAAIGAIGENLHLRRAAFLKAKQGIVAPYVHSAIAPGLGKIGVLVTLESEGDKAKLEELDKKIAMHVAAARPEALNRESVDPAKLAREREVFKQQAIASGKPPEIAEKMVEGRVRKYYEEVALLEQLFVMDGKTKISDVIAQAAKEIGKPVAVTAFERFQLGEGVEKQETDFAAEVAAAAGGR